MGESPRHDCAALLAQADWVRALARRLTANQQAADDLAQDALAAALVRPPPLDRPLRGWLSGVLRNLVREERRGRAHRGARERAAAREEAVASRAELLERLDSHRIVVDAVGRLAEPYRTAILLRYFESLSPGAIARRTGTPLRTVHTRLHRALARLRADLDRAHGGDRRAWVLALIPYARGSGGSSPAALGALVMDAKLKLAAAGLAVVGICSLVTWRGVAQADAPPAARAAAEVAQRELPPRAAEDSVLETSAVAERRALERPPEPPAAAPAPAPAVEAPRLPGRVLDAEHAAVAGIRVRYSAREPGAGGALEATTDASGAFSLALPEGGGTLDVASPGWAVLFRPEFADAPAAREVVLVVARSVTLGGRVVDEQGRPVPAARVAVPLPFRLRARFAAVLDDANTVERGTLTGEDGRFELAGVPVVAGVELVTTRAAFLELHRALPTYDDLALELVLRRATQGPERLLGRVVDPAGDPVEGAWIALGESSTKSGPNGAFGLELGAAPPPAGLVLRAVKAGYLPAERELGPPESWPEQLVLELGPPPLSIQGRVVDARGEPVPLAEVWTDEETHFGYVPLEDGEMSVSVGASVEGLLRADPWTFRARADSAGRFDLQGLLPRDYRLRAFDRARLALATETAAAGAHDVVLRLPEEELRPRVAGRVTTLSGEPLAGLRVVLERPALGPGPADLLEGRAALTGADGGFAFEQVSRAAEALRVQGEELGLEGFRHTLGAGDDPASLELRIPLKVHVQIDAGETEGVERVALLDARGERLALSVEHGEHAYSMHEIELDHGRSESFSVSELAATLVLSAQGAELRRLPVALVRGELNIVRP